MQKISPMLADPLLQIGDTTGQLGPLVLQRRDNMWFGHNPYPLEKMRLCSSRWALLASRSGWRLIHKTGTTGPRFPISRPADENEKCKGSSHQDPPSASSRCTLPPTTP